MASSGSDGSEAAPLDAQARVQLLLEFLHDRQLDLEELAEERRARFEQCVQLGKTLSFYISPHAHRRGPKTWFHCIRGYMHYWVTPVLLGFTVGLAFPITVSMPE